MSYFCLLDLNGSGYSTDDLESVADNWAAYNLAYMGGNVQWVFFRNKKGEVIARFEPMDSMMKVETAIRRNL